MGMGFPMGMGIPWESHGNGTKTRNREWEWEGMGNHLSGNAQELPALPVCYSHSHAHLYPIENVFNTVIINKQDFCAVSMMM